MSWMDKNKSFHPPTGIRLTYIDDGKLIFRPYVYEKILTDKVLKKYGIVPGYTLRAISMEKRPGVPLLRVVTRKKDPAERKNEILSAAAAHYNLCQDTPAVVILAFVGWASLARIIRGLVLSIKNEEYVLSARALGLSDIKIIVKHVLPNTLSFVIIQATLTTPGYILGESALSLPGLGITEPQSSWGLMLSVARNHRVIRDFPWTLIPGFCIFIVIVVWNFFGVCIQKIGLRLSDRLLRLEEDTESEELEAMAQIISEYLGIPLERETI